MTILDLINQALSKASVAVVNLDAFIAHLASKYPDAAPELNEYLAKLRAATTNEGLAALAKTIVDELKGLPSTGLDPRPHPSDLA